MTLASWLYAPASTSDLAGRAARAGADVAVFDLEDAVPVEQKLQARDHLAEQLSQRVGHRVAIRINALDTPWGLEDVLFLRSREIQFDYLLIPKANILLDSYLIHSLLGSVNPALKISVIVESIRTLSELQQLSAVPSYVDSVTFGSLDFAADMCVSPFDFDFSNVKRDLVFNARRLGVRAIDTPCFNINDPDEVLRDVREAKTLGFDGKVAIHPKQVPIINAEFQADLAMARDMASHIAQGGGTARSGLKRFGDMAYGPPIVRYVENVLTRDARAAAAT